MLFGNGQLLKTNVHFEDNEFEYYRLVGEAYNQHKLDRAVVAPKTLQLLQTTDGPETKKKAETTTFYTYVINGLPQTLAHNTLYDAKYGFSKQVFVKSTASNSYKLYSTSCSKLPYNKNSKERINECRLASGFFVVSQAGLFKTLCGAGTDGLSK